MADPSYYDDVLEFQTKTGLVVGTEPHILDGDSWARRIRLMLEELSEVSTAHAAKDIIEFADGLADLVWVVIGTAVEAGIPFDAIWKEVRRANLAKAGGRLDSSGKLMKPDGWTPPDHRVALGAETA